jgi:hypothetical protein
MASPGLASDHDQRSAVRTSRAAVRRRPLATARSRALPGVRWAALSPMKSEQTVRRGTAPTISRLLAGNLHVSYRLQVVTAMGLLLGGCRSFLNDRLLLLALR